MNEWIILTALAIAALSIAAIASVCRCCRKMVLEKERRIMETVREQERLMHELALTRSEKQHLWQVLTGKRRSGEVGATAETPADTETQPFETPNTP